MVVDEIEHILSFYVRQLNKRRVGWGKTKMSEAKGVSRNEALKDWYEIKTNRNALHPENFSDLRIRTLTLHKTLRPGISPFQPSSDIGFYVCDARAIYDKGTNVEKGMDVELYGLTTESATLSLLQFIAKLAYKAKIVTDPSNKFKGLLVRDDFEVGTVSFFSRAGNRCLKVKLRSEKSILIKYWNNGLVIKNVIFCPTYIVETVLPELLKLKDNYDNLRITKSKLFLAQLEKSKNLNPS